MLISDLPKDPVTDLGKSPDALRMAHAIAEGHTDLLSHAILDRGAGTGIVTLMCAVADFINGGSVSYALVPELQEEFGGAEIPDGLSFQDIELPAPSFWVGLPKSTLMMGSTTGPVPVEGILVTQNQTINRWLATTKEGRGHKIPPSYELTLWGHSSGKNVMSGTLINEVMLASPEAHFETYFGSPRSVPIFRTFLEEEPHQDEVPLSLNEEMIVATRYILNLLLHLNMPRPWLSSHQLDPRKELQSLLKKASKLKSSKKKRKVRKQVSNLPKVTYIVLDAPARASSSRVGSQRESGARAGHWRRGHYQRYWKGSKKDSEGNPIKGSHCEWKYTSRAWVSGVDRPSTTTKVVTKLAFHPSSQMSL